MEIFVTRHPIFDAEKEVYGYELLFRESMTKFIPDIDGDTKSSNVLIDAFTSAIDKVSEGKIAFINFTQNMLEEKIPLLYAPEKIVVEVLEHVEGTSKAAEACKELIDKGYRLALDNFALQKDLIQLIPFSSIIKIDLKAMPVDKIKMIKAGLEKKKKDIVFLCENIETYKDFELAQSLGFTLFQGFFFSKPEVLQKKDISASLLNLAQILNEVNKNDDVVDFDKIEGIINLDPGLSYKLLKLINSAFYKRMNEVSSIKQAVVFLGLQELRRFISLMMLSEVSSEKPDELIKNSCFRARFCELLGKNNNYNDPSKLYTLGMFSLLDAILDQSMEDIVENLPLSKDLKESLESKSGPLSEYLILIEEYELGNWESVETLAAKLDVNEDSIPVMYMEACEWANPEEEW